MEEKRLKVAVIGCGYWGPNLIRNFNQIDSADLSYICDIDGKRMEMVKKNYPEVKTTTNYHEILQNPEIDAIVVALPVSKHFQVSKEGLLSGKHVLVEKPMTSSVEEAKELIRIAKEKNKVLMVDHTFEYSEAIRMIKNIFESGELGKIYYIRAEWLNLGLLQPDVNVIWDLATHVLSIIHFITGLKPTSLNVNAKGHIREEIPEMAQINIKFDKAVSAYICVSWLEPKKTRKMTIVGDKKLLVYDLTNTEEPIKVYDKGIDFTRGIEDLRQLKVNYKYGDTYSPNVKNIESLNTMCKHFVDCIKNNEIPRSDGESGLRIVEILENTDKSLKEDGKEINLENNSKDD